MSTVDKMSKLQVSCTEARNKKFTTEGKISQLIEARKETRKLLQSCETKMDACIAACKLAESKGDSDTIAIKNSEKQALMEFHQQKKEQIPKFRDEIKSAKLEDLKASRSQNRLFMKYCELEAQNCKDAYKLAALRWEPGIVVKKKAAEKDIIRMHLHYKEQVRDITKMVTSTNSK